jgi:hypothetical protein
MKKVVRLTESDLSRIVRRIINESDTYSNDDLINSIIEMDGELERDPIYKEYEDRYLDNQLIKTLQMKMGFTEVPKEMLTQFKEMGKMLSGDTKLTPDKVMQHKDNVITTSQEIMKLAIEDDEFNLASKLRDFVNLLKQL